MGGISSGVLSYLQFVASSIRTSTIGRTAPIAGGMLQKAAGVVVSPQQRFDAAAQLGVALAGGVEKVAARFAPIFAQCLNKDAFNRLAVERRGGTTGREVLRIGCVGHGCVGHGFAFCLIA